MYKLSPVEYSLPKLNASELCERVHSGWSITGRYDLFRGALPVKNGHARVCRQCNTLEPRPPRPELKEIRRKTAHILVVDDEPAIQTLLRISLQKVGYTVQGVGTGRAALDVSTAYDLVLLDIQLPDMNGFAVCVELRKRSQMPIVILTALNRAEDIIQGFNVGADDYITKPYHMAEMAARLGYILQRTVQCPAENRAHDGTVLRRDKRTSDHELLLSQ